MAYATYGGLALFGVSMSARPQLERRGSQRNAFPGLNGVEHLDLGSRGATTVIEGTWFADSEADLAATLATWEALCDGVPRSFVDTLGRIWANVLLEPYRLEGVRKKSAATGAVMQRFSGTLYHLTLPSDGT